MATFLVTGGAGFVGSHLTELLLELKHTVCVLDDLRSGYIRNLKGCSDPVFWNAAAEIGTASPDCILPLGKELVFYKGSITNSALVDSLLANHSIDTIFHLAAIVSVPYSCAHEEETIRINYDGTRTLCELARMNGCRALVHAGSSAEYGDLAPLPAREQYITGKTMQNSPYGRTKYKAGRFVAGQREIIGTSLRCFNIFGPRQDPTSQYSGVISKFMECVTHRKQMTVFGDGEQTRDFIYVKDVAAAYCAAAGLTGTTSAGTETERIFNVGSGAPISINRLAEKVISLSGVKVPIANISPRLGDIKHSFADISRIQDTLSWRPRTGLEEGLKETYAWYKNQ
jgi:UDP-glucose 4-epimerase